MTIHSSVLSWEIPWTEEPGRLQAAVHGMAKSWTRLSNQHFHFHSLPLMEQRNKLLLSNAKAFKRKPVTSVIRTNMVSAFSVLQFLNWVDVVFQATEHSWSPSSSSYVSMYLMLTYKNTCFCFQELLGSSKSVLSWQKFDLTAMEDAASVEWKN